MDVLATPLLLAGAASALATGATGSLHCALMCGPLACAGVPTPPASRWRAMAAWHLGRTVAYAAVGLLLGAVGTGVGRAVSFDVAPVLPWVMAAGLVASALELGRYVRPLPGVGRVATALAQAGAKLPASWRSVALGAATPFLPCGLLYGLFLAAMATGSALGGAAVMAAFALGAAPALLLTQVGARWALEFPRTATWLRRIVPLTAALVLVWRAMMTASQTAPGCQ